MNDNVLAYRDYVATVRLDAEAGLLRGRVEGIREELVFETADAGAAEAMFHDVVDRYLAHCAATHCKPARQYRGTFSVRMEGALHGALVHWAKGHGVSLNTAVLMAVRAFLAGQEDSG